MRLMLLSLLILSMPSIAKLDVTTQALFWNSSPMANFGEADDSTIEIGNEGNQQSSLSLGIEHALPWAMNVKLVKTSTASSGETTLTQTYRLGNQLYKVATSLHGNKELNQLDAVFYYELYDNRNAEFDLGIVGREYHVQLNVYDKDQPSSQSSRSVKLLVPMLYAAGKLNFQLMNFKLSSEMKWHSANDYDTQFAVNYNVISLSNVKADLVVGWRKSVFEADGFSDLVFSQQDESAFAGFELAF